MCLSVNRKRKERKYLSVKDMGRNVQVNLRELEEIQEQCYTHTASVLCENIRERERDRPKVATENAFERERERERENGNAVTREREESEGAKPAILFSKSEKFSCFKYLGKMRTA